MSGATLQLKVHKGAFVWRGPCQDSVPLPANGANQTFWHLWALAWGSWPSEKLPTFFWLAHHQSASKCIASEMSMLKSLLPKGWFPLPHHRWVSVHENGEAWSVWIHVGPPFDLLRQEQSGNNRSGIAGLWPPSHGAVDSQDRLGMARTSIKAQKTQCLHTKGILKL